MTGATEPEAEAAPPSLLRQLLTVLGGEAAISLASSALARASLLALVVEVIVAEWVANRLGVKWGANGAKRAAKGVAFGFGLAAMVMTVTLVARHGELSFNRPTSALATLGLSAGTVILSAIRDELMLRGSILRLARLARLPRLPERAKLVGTDDQRNIWPLVQMLLVVALVGAAQAAGDDLPPRAIVSATALAVVFGTLWLLDEGFGWRAIAAHAAWSFVESGLAGSGMVDLHANGVALDAFHTPLAAGALIFAAVACGAALLFQRRIATKVG